MGRGQRVNRSSWPAAGPHRRLLEVLDRIHEENGLKPAQEIAEGMGLKARSRVNSMLRGQGGRLPADEQQLRLLVSALGGGPDDFTAALQHFRDELADRQRNREPPATTLEGAVSAAEEFAPTEQGTTSYESWLPPHLFANLYRRRSMVALIAISTVVLIVAAVLAAVTRRTADTTAADTTAADTTAADTTAADTTAADTTAADTTAGTAAGLPGCDDIGALMTGIDNSYWGNRQPWWDAYNRAGGKEALGCPVPKYEQGFVHRWGAGMSQDLKDPKGLEARLMAIDPATVIVMAGDYWFGYTRPHLSRAADVQGYPTSDPVPCDGAKIARLVQGEWAPGAMVSTPDDRHFVWLPRPVWNEFVKLGGVPVLGRPFNYLGQDIQGRIDFEYGSIELIGGVARSNVRPDRPGSPAIPYACPS